jgi:3-hydroxyacyl-[acyl-carrier-protein] dehydratase
MLLVDEILEESDQSILCKKTFSEDEYFFAGHFPGSPIVPGVIQCECCLQSGALLIASAIEQDLSENSGMLPVATRMDSVKFKRMVHPGDEVQIQVNLNDQVSNAYYLTGKMTLAGKLVMRLDFSVTMTANTANSKSADNSASGDSTS